MTFTEVLQAAQDTDDPEDYITRVKRAVLAQLEALDTTSKVESTPYFNHTAVPDFVVSWPGEARKISAQRAVFLRHSYHTVAAEGDEQFLGQTDAIVLAIQPRGRKRLSARSDAQTPTPSRLLLTDSKAVGLVATQDSESRDSGGETPLRDLVRANFIRGARGRIDSRRAKQLLNLGQPGGSEDVVDSSGLIASAFIEDAAARITRTAQLMDLASKGTGDEEMDDKLIGGRLSLAEMRHLIPWILKRDPKTVHETFWPYLGGLFGFKELEAIRADLVGLDLTHLIVANAERWSGTRAYVGLNIEEVEVASSVSSTDASDSNRNVRDRANEVAEVSVTPDDRDGDQVLDPEGSASVGPEEDRRWGFHAGARSALSVDLGSRRLYVAHLGNLLKQGRPGSSAATWGRVKETIGSTRLRRVYLRGIQSSVSIDAEQSPDIQGRVDKLTASLEDRYFVEGITLRYENPAADKDYSDIAINFGEGLAIAAETASIANLAAAALGVTEHRNPATPEEVARLLGRDSLTEVNEDMSALGDDISRSAGGPEGAEGAR